MSFLKIDLSSETLQTFGKVTEVIDRLQIFVIGFARISAPSSKSFPEKLSMTAAFKMSIDCIISKSSFPEVSLRWKGVSMRNFE